MTTTSAEPKYIQLANHVRQLIQSGELKAGDRLPSYVEFYRRFGATTATVQRVCHLLEQEQLIERRSGSGIYVAQPRRARTNNICLIASAAHQTPRTPFQTRLIGALNQAATGAGQHLLYLGTEAGWYKNAMDNVDGVLVCGTEYPDTTFENLPAQLPVVSLLNIIEGVNSVGIDEYQAGRMAARHLLEARHRRIACLMERQPLECRRRLAGVTDYLQENGIELEADWTRLTGKVYAPENSWNTDQPYREWACQQMQEWLDNGWREAGCTALIVQNEVAAIGAIQTLQAAGIQVPEEVSVITFDGTELCDLISPSISAVALPLEQIGTRAVELLLQQIERNDNQTQAIVLPIQLRPGQSVIPPA